MTILELDSVTKKYGDFTAVDNVSFGVEPGEVCGFLGPNGAGKTTTIRMILEILRPTSGTISILGSNSALAVRRRIGYLPEEKGLYKKMTAASTVAYFASLKGLSARESRERARELLDRYGLGKFAGSKTEALSKGMGQKVQVLAAIAHDPDLVILDEPFSGLDPVNQQVMEEIVHDFAARKKTVLFSTHVMAHAERLCDRIVLVTGGQKIFDGTIPEAKATLPKTVRIESSGDVSGLADLPEVNSVEAVPATVETDDLDADASASLEESDVYDLMITESGDPQRVIEVAFETGLRLRRFEVVDPSLHDVFVHLVGPEARTAAYR